MGKQKSKAPFYYFMLDVIEEEKKKGNTYTIQNVNQIAGPRWSKMTESQRRPYYEKSGKSRKNHQPGPSVPLAGLRLPTTAEQQRVNYRRKFQDYMLNENLTDEKVRDMKFCMIDFNILYKVDNRFYPIELGAVKFSLNEGIIDQMHTFIHCGPIIAGYYLRATDHAQESHKIPFDGEGIDVANAVGMCVDPITRKVQHNERRKDFDILLTKLMAMIDSCLIEDFEEKKPATEEGEINDQKPLRLVFCPDPTRLEQTLGCLKYLAQEAHHSHAIDRIEVLSYRDLYFYLNSRVSYKMLGDCEQELKQMTFFHNGLCFYHHEKQVGHCAISTCRIALYLSFSELNELYKFDLTPKHKPKDDLKRGLIITKEFSDDGNSSKRARSDRHDNKLDWIPAHVEPPKEEEKRRETSIRYAGRGRIVRHE